MDSTLFALMILSRTARSAAAYGGRRSLTRSSTRTTGIHAIKAAMRAQLLHSYNENNYGAPEPSP
jgi:hypothetical protein